MATGLGISPNAVEEMYVDRAEEQIAYWANHPPVHILVAGAVGFKPQRGRGSMSAAELAAKFGGKAVKRG